mmetsp:Transcript_696/g.853  ORF Transcript_696/g.853 Transcript_696/m.853 type:complete len:214 (+) Transcript_696:887-1528(+)
MVAEYRCNQIKEEALDQVKTDIIDLKAECSKSLTEDFQHKCKAIVKSSLNYFEEQASQYKSKVYDKIKNEVAEYIFNQLFMSFDLQLKLLTTHCTKSFSGELRRICKKGVVNDKFYRESSEIYDRIMSEYKVKSANLIIDGTGWGDRVVQHLDDLVTFMDNERDTMRNKEIDKLQSLTTKATFETIEEIVNDPIYNLDDDFWKNISYPLGKEF